MFDQINVSGASTNALLAAMGKAMKARVMAQGTITHFADKSGFPRNSLYRLFNGETVSSDMLIKALQVIGMNDVLTLLTSAPPKNPLTYVSNVKVPKTAPAPPSGLPAGSTAKPTYLTR